jgi:retinol-binding protein 3
LLKENYIFPERISKIEAVIKEKLDNNLYAGFNTLFDFLEHLNADLETSGNDKHLDIFYGPKIVLKLKNDTLPEQKKIAPPEYVKMLQYENFKLRKAERLDGNIGYFKLNGFIEPEYSKEAIVSAMNFLSNSSAVIIDLRENGGGSAETVHFLLNYFLPDSTKLGAFKRRINNEVVELWTTKDPLIKKVPENIPVYILVSKNTSSAAESFAYGLQQFKRATIVGEQTHGEGNPGMRFVINEKLYMMIPTAVNVNAITGTNWEGVGVTPDIKINATDAFAKTIVEICQVLSKKDDNNIYKWIIPEYEAQLNPEFTSAEFINSIVGNYDEGKKISQENGSLYYSTKTSKRKMIYMGKQVFLMDGRKDYRMRFAETKKGIEYVEFLWNDGTVDKIKKVD